jgi:cellulose synthase/poly-beta-1,6-N-acetylglucosamine synthase-like glycosyltransferase
MIFVFYILAVVLVYLSYRSLRSGIEYLTYFKSEPANPPIDYEPFASVIAPCKGMEDGVEENLGALFEQDYPNYEIVFVVDDEADPVIAVIESVSRKHSQNTTTKLVVAPKASASSQKVENLREAVLHVDERSEVFAFVDSDARPAKDWLRSLVAPLEDTNLGAATGYRWFISTKPTLASELRNVWNASIASALGPNTKDNFCWGGSMAIRRDTFEKLDIREKWRGTLSDDFTVTRAMNAANLQIKFVPRALTASIDDCSFSEMLEFTTRQMKITRVYSPKHWIMSFLGSGLFCFVMTTAFLIATLSPRNGIEIYISTAILFLVTGLGIAKSWVRLKAVRMALKDHETLLRKQSFPQLTLWLISPFVFLWNCIAALVSRRLLWRGVEYELVSETHTRLLEPHSRQ